MFLRFLNLNLNPEVLHFSTNLKDFVEILKISLKRTSILLYGYIGVELHGYFWLYLAISGYIWLDLVRYGCIWLDLAISLRRDSMRLMKSYDVFKSEIRWRIVRCSVGLTRRILWYVSSYDVTYDAIRDFNILRQIRGEGSRVFLLLGHWRWIIVRAGRHFSKSIKTYSRRLTDEYRQKMILRA